MTPTRRNPDGVASCIRAAQRIAIVCHVNPDGDALGSSLAMMHAIRALGKDAVCFCHDHVPQSLKILPGSDTVMKPESAAGQRFDLLLCVDTADEKRMGDCTALIAQADAWVQIDHHGTNPGYAKQNDIDPSAAATALMVREMISLLGVPMTRELAMCIYAGVSTDTGNFAFPSTDARVFVLMSELMRYDLPLGEMHRILFRQRSRAQAALVGCALQSLNYYADGRVTTMCVTADDMRRLNALPEDADAIVNFGLDIVGVQMAAFARETEDGSVKFSLRAVAPYAVGEIARALGGGGHALASGCTVDGPLDEAMMKVREMMIEAINKELA